MWTGARDSLEFPDVGAREGDEAAAAGFALSGVVAQGNLSGTAVTILVQSLAHDRFVLHALADNADTAARIEASRGLEALRRQAEGALA